MENSNNKKSDCCTAIGQEEGKGFFAGIIYGLIPHIGCIAFIVFTVLGVTTATALFRPLLLNPYFFYILIGLSFVFVTISAIIYLKTNEMLSISGIKRKWKYLSILYGTTILINLFLFMVVFPYATNFMSIQEVTKTPTLNYTTNPISSQIASGASDGAQRLISTLTIEVAIPCSGHAPLITTELNKFNGVIKTDFSFPNIFTIHFDSTKTSKQKILSLDIFDTYKATVLDESLVQQNNQQATKKLQNTNVGCCGGAGICGGGVSGGCGCGALRRN